MAAVLSGGPSALASHRSAAALWKLEGIDEGPMEISVKAGRRIRGATVHRRRATDDPLVSVLDGIPATVIERTLLDLAATAPPGRTAAALDDALRRRLTTLPDLRAMLGSVAPRGRIGTRTLRTLVNDRDDRDAALESRLESALLRVLRRHGVELPVLQHAVVTGGAVVARLDFAYPQRRVGIETDGYRWHGSPERWRRDLRRENRLKLLGWMLLRFSWDDVHRRPEAVIAQVRQALANAEATPHSLP
jgi:very-short-patch-repair endonuclease